jgi:hypothetical protein
MFKKLKTAIVSMLELAAVEARDGITAVEALRHNKFEAELARVTTNADERQALRDLAIVAGQLGISTAEDLQEMARNQHFITNNSITSDDVRALRIIKGQVR